MQRGLLVFLLSVFSLSIAQAEEVPLDAWVGKDPFALIGGTDFFHHPKLQDVIEKLTGTFAPESARVRVPWPVRQSENLVVVQFCDPKSCLNKNYALLLDLRTGDLGFCSFSEAPTTMSYTVKFSYQRSNATMTLNGILSNALADGCLEQDTAKLGKIWESYLLMAR